MRAMAYLGLVYNARGEWAFSVSDIIPFPGNEWVWAGLSNVARQLRRLEPVLADPELPSHPLASNTSVKTALKEYQGASYLITVNASNTTCTNCSVDLVAPHLFQSGNNAIVLEEARTKPMVDNGDLTDTWTPYAVHVYQVPRDTASPSTPVLSLVSLKGKKAKFRVVVSDNAAVSTISLYNGSNPTPFATRVLSPPVRNATVDIDHTFTSGTYVVTAKATDVNANPPSAASNPVTIVVH